MQNAGKVKLFSKRMYAIIVIIGVVLLGMAVYGIYCSEKTNNTDRFLLRTVADIKYRSASFPLKLDEYTKTGSMEKLQNLWQDLDFVTNSITLLLDGQIMEGKLFAFVIDDEVRGEFQELREDLLGYRELALLKVESRGDLATNKKHEDELNTNYENIQSSSEILIEKLDQMRKTNLGNCTLIQIVILTISIFFVIFVIIYFYKFDKQHQKAIKTIQEANNSLEREIREHHLAEEALHESEERLSRLISNLPGMVYRCKNDERRSMLFISEGCLSITGYRSEEYIENENVKYFDIIHTEDQQNVREQIKAALEKKKPFQLVYRIITAPGFEKWVWEQGVGIFSDKGFVIAIEGFVIDITEQRTAESQLLLLSTALETAANGIMITDAEGNFVWINAAFTKMTGYMTKDVLGKNARILKSGMHKESYYKELWDTIISGEVWHGELVNQRMNGTYYDEEITISPVKDTMGRISHFIGIKHDITERKQADKALRESEERFRGLYENATIGIYQTSTEGKVLMANPTMVNMLGFNSFEELHFVSVERGYTNPDQRKEFREIIERDGVVFGFESAWRKSDRNIIYIRESARAIKDEKGKIRFYEGTIEDITERKRAEYALIEAKEKAEKSDLLKTEFLAQMSHEIRTPINALLSFSSMIRDEVEDKVEDDLKEGFKIIDLEGKRVIRTVDLILNMAQLQTDSYSPVIQMVDIYTDVISGSFNEYEPMATEKGLQFLLMKKTDNTFIMADEYSLKQIINNLFDNAIKYSSSGKIEATIERDNEERLRVQISDTGIGISKEYLKTLFTPFTQEEHGYSRKFDGNGLGLALVKKYCELNNAEIMVKSEKGKGSTFTIIFSA